VILLVIGGSICVLVLMPRREGMAGLIVAAPEYSASGRWTNQSMTISNSLKRPVTVSFGHQVFSNAAWTPAKEFLFRHPQFPLEAGETVSYRVPDPPTNTWRFLVLQQKHYGESWLGEFAEFLDRRRFPERFHKGDHRGISDVFRFSVVFGDSGENDRHAPLEE
jgi:hypothetical protein